METTVNFEELRLNKADRTQASSVDRIWIMNATSSGLMENHHFMLLGPKPWDEVLSIIANEPEDHMFDKGMAGIVEALVAAGIVTTTSSDGTGYYADFPMVGMKLDEAHFDYLTKLIEDTADDLALTNGLGSTTFVLHGSSMKKMTEFALVLYDRRDESDRMQSMVPSAKEIMCMCILDTMEESMTYRTELDWPEALVNMRDELTDLSEVDVDWSEVKESDFEDERRMNDVKLSIFNRLIDMYDSLDIFLMDGDVECYDFNIIKIKLS